MAWGERAVRKGFLAEALANQRLKEEWEWEGREESILSGRTSLCKGLGVV